MHLKHYFKYCLVTILGIASLAVQGQDIYEKYNIYRSPFRVFINKFSITATTGYGSTTYKHDLNGVYFFQDAQNQFIFPNNEVPGETFVGYSDWLNDPQLGAETSLQNSFDVPFDYLPNPVNNPLLVSRQFLIDTDTANFGFKGASWGIPLTISLHYNILDFRIGGGFMYERQFVKELEPISFQGEVRSYTPNFSSTSYTKFFGLVGYKFYSFWSYDFVAELQVGNNRAGRQFNRAVIDRGLYTNFGISIENNWSEYFRVIVKPSLDFKKYTLSLPTGQSIEHRHPSFFLQVGVSINIPEIPRSPMKSDHTQLKHIYTDPKTGRLMEVRGQPIWKRQNPKMGENHRNLKKHRPSSKDKVKSNKAKRKKKFIIF